MCTGIEIGLLATAAAAGATQYTLEKRSNNDLSNKTYRIISDTNAQTNALQQVREDEQKKQADLQGQANQEFADTTAQFSPEQQKRQQEEQAAKATANLQLAPEFIQASAPLQTSAGAPSVVQDAIDKRLAQSTDKANTYAQNLGGLEGYGGSSFLNSLALTKLANDQATRGTLSQSSANVANEADATRQIQNTIGQNLINLWTAQNKSGGVRQAAGLASTVKNAALFAALTGGLGAGAGSSSAAAAPATTSSAGSGAGGVSRSSTSLAGSGNFGGLFS